MTVDVTYNEFQNWAVKIPVRHPECEHPTEKQEVISLLIREDRTEEAVMCGICEAIQVATDDGEYEWKDLEMINGQQR